MFDHFAADKALYVNLLSSIWLLQNNGIRGLVAEYVVWSSNAVVVNGAIYDVYIDGHWLVCCYNQDYADTKFQTLWYRWHWCFGSTNVMPIGRALHGMKALGRVTEAYQHFETRQFLPGDLIDVQRRNLDWLVGKVIAISKDSCRVIVQYKAGCLGLFDESFPLSSTRLAARGTHTEKALREKLMCHYVQNFIELKR
jgi:hypothetical protein